jgi:hypothetical protein
MQIKRILKLVRHDGHMNASFAFSGMSAMSVNRILSIIKLKLVRSECLTSHAHTQAFRLESHAYYAHIQECKS